MRCITCGYRLRDLEDNRCPECGRAFDPDDSETTLPDHPPRFERRLLLTWFCVAGLFAVVGLIAYNMLGTNTVLTPFGVAIGIPLLISVAIVGVWYSKRRKFKD